MLFRFINALVLTSAVIAKSSIDNIPSLLSTDTHIKQARQSNPGGYRLCLLWIETYPWTTCQSFLQQQNITGKYLALLNQNVGSDCYGWSGGSRYCVLSRYVPKTSTDGTCGRSSGFTCIGSSFGDCCGKNGRTAVVLQGNEFCDIGNCQDGNCPGIGYSTDGNCGKDYQQLRCGGKYGRCCSKAGKCGSTSAECGVGNCQSGDCAESTSTSIVPTSTTSVPLPSPSSPSTDGTCGGTFKYKCTDTKVNYGKCCGARGFCGFSNWECNDLLGCQGEYGLCDKTVRVVKNETIIFNDDFNHAGLPGWTQYGGQFENKGNFTFADSSYGGKLLIDKISVTDFTYKAMVLTREKSKGDSGVVFRVSNPAVGADAYSGYYAGITDGYVVLGKADGGWKEMNRVALDVQDWKFYSFIIKAVGDELSIYVDDAVTPKIRIRDGSHKKGTCGFRVYNSMAIYTNVTIVV